MKKGNFSRKIRLRYDTVILNDVARQTREWRELIGLKKSTNYIGKCKFENGKCNGFPYWVPKDSPACCCHGCANEVGYLGYMLESDIEYYAERFDRKTGFWREGKGCLLNRSMRSRICLCYICSKEKKNIHKLLNQLKNTMNYFETILVREFG